MSSCEKCAHFDTPPLGYPCYRCFDFNMWEEKLLVTNADHICSMSDSELMFFLNAVIVNHHVKTADNCRHCPLKAAKPCDTEGLIDWLQMPWNEKE